jgi:hypothetical protein
MAANTYYFEVKDHPGDVPNGVYSCQSDVAHMSLIHLGYFQISHRVWRQGPRGGVKIVRDRGWDLYSTTYITNNPKWMQKFAWVKLKARPI